MNQVILIYKTDCWHSYQNRELLAVATSKEKAIQLCLEHSADEGNELNKEQLELLNRINQTQGHTGEGEYVLESVDTDTL